MNYPTRTRGGLGAQARSPRIVLCGQKDDPFARVLKSMLDDPAISWRAKGILAYLIGKPRDWKVRVSDLQKHSKEGRDSVRTALNELRNAGYAKLIDIRDDRGRLIEWMWTISDSRIFDPLPEKPDLDNPEVDNQYHTKKDCTEIDSTKNQTEETKETAEVSAALSDSEFEAQWIPDRRSKEQKLRSLKTPRQIPSEIEFESFIEANGLEHVRDFRPCLYSELSDLKWHQWRDKPRKWVPILDWGKYVSALDQKLASQF